MNIQGVVFQILTPCSDIGFPLFGGPFHGEVTSTWRWRQHGPPKLWYPTTTVYGVTKRRPREDRSSMDLWKVGILPQHYKAS